MAQLNDVKVEQLDNKNQFIIRTNKGTYFQSYDSLIAFYDGKNDKLHLSNKWDYSKTTLKHLYIFIDSYVFIRAIKEKLECTNNKRKEIQKLIDNKTIKLDLEA